MQIRLARIVVSTALLLLMAVVAISGQQVMPTRLAADSLLWTAPPAVDSSLGMGATDQAGSSTAPWFESAHIVPDESGTMVETMIIASLGSAMGFLSGASLGWDGGVYWTAPVGSVLGAALLPTTRDTEASYWNGALLGSVVGIMTLTQIDGGGGLFLYSAIQGIGTALLASR